MDHRDIGAAFVVKDSAGQKLAYVYYEEEPGRQSAAKLLGAAFVAMEHAGRCTNSCKATHSLGTAHRAGYMFTVMVS